MHRARRGSRAQRGGPRSRGGSPRAAGGREEIACDQEVEEPAKRGEVEVDRRGRTVSPDQRGAVREQRLGRRRKDRRAGGGAVVGDRAAGGAAGRGPRPAPEKGPGERVRALRRRTASGNLKRLTHPTSISDNANVKLRQTSLRQLATRSRADLRENPLSQLATRRYDGAVVDPIRRFAA